jgi:hypothetical protein
MLDSMRQECSLLEVNAVLEQMIDADYEDALQYGYAHCLQFFVRKVTKTHIDMHK